MAESDPVKSAGPDVSVPEAQPASSGDGISATVAPDDDDSVAMTDWSAGQVILDDFVVERELGQGGMGKVYLLRSRSTGQPFAVKRAFLRNEDSRRNFLAELRTWIDLPEHPHLVACRFFRTVGDEVVIFAEFVEGGSLADWIRDRRLTRLEQILDAAIQFAWGLHAAHELGLVHQDVKPGNALMTGDGLVKVADFGLARARAVAVQGADEARLRPDVTGYFGTPAYKSPEQAVGERLTLATDVWSWGLAVLEMFSGERFWTIGVAAPDALKAYLKRPADPELPTMPNGVAEVLQKCFRRDPAERWGSLAEATEVLQRAYRQAAGNDYPRPMPATPELSRQATVIHERHTAWGGHWDNPREWLIQAFTADGRDPAQVEAFLSPRAGSRKAQALADLAAYEEAWRILERLVADGRKDLEAVLPALCINKAFVHENTDDVPGAVALYDRAISICERLVEQGIRPELANELAAACINRANAASALGDRRAALALYDRAIAIREQLFEHQGRPELAKSLATAFVAKANALGALGDTRAAVALYDRAISIRERLVTHERQTQLEKELAAVYMNKASAVSALGDKGAAAALCERAIAILGRLVEQERPSELANALARACMNGAITLYDMGEFHRAVALNDRAIPLLERLVEQAGHKELADELARACMNKANAVGALGDMRTAVALCDRAIAIRERLVIYEGRQELQGSLAWSLAVRARALVELGDHQRARNEARRAVSILKTEIARTGRASLQGVLDWATKALQDVL